VSESFRLDAPDHFTVGTVGPPGQRTFYLQAREDRDALVTLKCEKTQVAALGDYLAGLLARMKGDNPAAGTAAALLEPIEAAWTVGSLGVGYDEASDRIVVVANEAADDEQETPGEPASARFAITRGQAATFVAHANKLQRAGRPTCPMCGEPKDDTHVCPRANGHVVHRE
jgi:uncharacterized repeat protein (TIGR03847 family)